MITAVLTTSACTQAIDGSPAGTPPPNAATFPPGTSAPPPPNAPSATPSDPTPTPSVPAAAATFADCSQVLHLRGVKIPAGLQGKLTAGCAHYPVPLDYADPTGTKIDILMVRIHDIETTSPTGTLLLNPGGPGGSGVELVLGVLGKMSPKIVQHFDLLGFDPRGVSLSTPVHCLSDSEKDRLNAASPDVTTAAGFATARANAKNLAASCERRVGSGLKYYNTVNTARDMDQIRQAVGDDRLTYLGFSYGTELGSVYAHLFPDKVRAAVLDGAVNPLTSGTTQFADQLQGFEDAFDQFAAYCRKRAACNAVGNPRATVLAIEASAARTPLNGSDGRKLTASLAATGVLEALYSKQLWDKLGSALIDGENGDGAGLLKLADQYNQRDSAGHYSNISDANVTIGCNDSEPGPTDAQIHRIAASWAKRFPLFGKWSVPSLFTCQQWQPTRVVPPKPVAPTPSKVLVVGNLHDPATPYQGARDLTTTMGNAELLSWNGAGHTSYLQGSTCIDGYVDNYLVALQLPPQNTTCPP